MRPAFFSISPAVFLRWKLLRIAACALCAVQLPSFGQAPPGRPLPQEPAWSADNATDSNSTPDDAIDADAATAEPAPEDEALLIAPDTQAAESPSAPAEGRMSSKVAPDDIGVPSSSGLHLPTLGDSTEPFIQLDGLRLRVGVVQVRFSLDMNYGYNDNIFALNTPRTGDYITNFSPTFEFGIGNFPRPRPLVGQDEQANYVVLTYTPNFQFFAENTDQNTVNETLHAAGHYGFTRLIVDGSFDYVKSSWPTPTTIGRQEYSVYSVDLKAVYPITGRLYTQTTFGYSYTDYVNSIDFNTTSISPAIGYDFGPKLRLTLGPTVGVTYVEGGGEQFFQGLVLGFNYTNLSKLSFDGTVGVQATQFQGNNPTGAEDFIAPVFGIGGSWEMTATSSMSLDLSQTISNGGNGDPYIGTGVTLSYAKRFLDRVQLDLSGSYQAYDYQGRSSRTDTYLTFSARLGYLFWEQRCNVYLAYTRSQRLSDIQFLEYYQNNLSGGISIEF